MGSEMCIRDSGNAGATRESGSASTRRTRRADASTPSAAAESADVVRAGAGAGDSAATDAQLDAPPAPGSSDEPAADGLTAYECERLANLERNRTMLESLGLLSAAEAVRAQKRPARAAPSARGLALPKKKEAAPAAPERRSLRAQGKTPDGQFAAGVHAEGADGSVVVMVGGEAIRYSAAAAAAAALRAEDGIARREALERQARLDADRPFFSVNCTPRTDAAFVRLLAAAAPCAPAAAGDAAERAAAPPLGALCALALREGHVAKLTPRDIVHLGFQPRSDCLLLCAADKAGHVALWDVHGTADAHAGAADGDGAVADEGTGGADGAEGGVAGVGAHEADKGAPDGVLLLKPHDQYISGLKWSTHVPSRLFTASYDGTVRCLDLTRAPSARDGASGSGSGSGGATGGGCATAAFSLVLHAQDHEISAFETDASGVTAFFADNQGALLEELRGARHARAARTCACARIAALRLTRACARVLAAPRPGAGRRAWRHRRAHSSDGRGLCAARFARPKGARLRGSHFVPPAARDPLPHARRTAPIAMPASCALPPRACTQTEPARVCIQTEPATRMHPS